MSVRPDQFIMPHRSSRGSTRSAQASLKICANLILASRQGFGELKTEQLGGHSQEQQRHRQAPIDDDDDDTLHLNKQPGLAGSSLSV